MGRGVLRAVCCYRKKKEQKVWVAVVGMKARRVLK
jgi:hypothetical protein